VATVTDTSTATASPTSSSTATASASPTWLPVGVVTAATLTPDAPDPGDALPPQSALLADSPEQDQACAGSTCTPSSIAAVALPNTGATSPRERHRSTFAVAAALILAAMWLVAAAQTHRRLWEVHASDDHRRNDRR
jgi:hypothetical protein